MINHEKLGMYSALSVTEKDRDNDARKSVVDMRRHIDREQNKYIAEK